MMFCSPHSFLWQYASAFWLPGPLTPLSRCGPHLASQCMSHPLALPLRQSLPNPPLSTTLWSTCCSNPTSASLWPMTRLKSAEEYALVPARQALFLKRRIWTLKHPNAITTKTLATPLAFPMVYQKATEHVSTVPSPTANSLHRKGLPACWLAPHSVRWLWARCQRKCRQTSYEHPEDCLTHARKRQTDGRWQNAILGYLKSVSCAGCMSRKSIKLFRQQTRKGRYNVSHFIQIHYVLITSRCKSATILWTGQKDRACGKSMLGDIHSPQTCLGLPKHQEELWESNHIQAYSGIKNIHSRPWCNIYILPGWGFSFLEVKEKVIWEWET